jgi:hypothetical protein
MAGSLVGPRALRLVLVARRSANDEGDLRRIAAQIRREAPDVRPIVVRDRRQRLLRARLALSPRPTLVYSATALRDFRPPRGAVLQGARLSKVEELERLERAGIPVPRWRVLTREHTPDVSDFGPFVVMKPLIGARGADVRIVRRGRVRWLEPTTRLAARTPRWIVQEYVHTGPWPRSHRVLTLCGNALYAYRAEADRSREPIRDAADFGSGGRNIVASHKGCRLELCEDADVIDLAQRAHAAFEGIPLLGVDILRDAATGRLYVIEVNPGGRVWGFSSRRGRAMQAALGQPFDSQWNGLARAARILVEETRRRAC